MQGAFFTHVEVRRRANGMIVIVLQIKPVRGGAPLPVQIIECREAGALALMEALGSVLRN